MRVKICDGVPYSKERHIVPAINWSDGQLVYWGWIYARGGSGRVVGVFAANTVQEAEKYFNVKFTSNEMEVTE